MERFFLECALRAALVVGCTSILLRLMRVEVAAAKHRVWVGVLVLMMVLPLWTAFGPKAPIRLLPPLAQTSSNLPLAPAGLVPGALLQSRGVSIWEMLLGGIYLSGLSLLVFRLTLGTVRARRLVRGAVLYDSKLTSRSCVAPVTVGLFHPVIILPEHWRRWPQARLEAVLTHEGEHARRRDSLVQWFALLNRALFWFHPAAWWLERKLSALAEEACDNVVLALGHDPREYAESLIDMARSVTDSGTRLKITGMSMPGSFLQRRIRQILEGGQPTELSRPRMALVLTVSAITCTAFAAGTLEHARQTASQSTMAQREAASGTPAPDTKFVAVRSLTLVDRGELPGRIQESITNEIKSHTYKSSNLDEIAERVRYAFQRQGYFKVVVHDLEINVVSSNTDPEIVDVKVKADEGAIYRLKSIQFTKDTVLSAQELRNVFPISDGDILDRDKIAQGLEAIRHLYVAKGYVNFSAVPETHIDEAEHTISVVIGLDPGIRQGNSPDR